MLENPTVLFDSYGGSSFATSWRFDGYVKTVVATRLSEVAEALDQVDHAAAAGLYAAGFVAYEAASALNSDLPTVPHIDGLPLVWFALFRERHNVVAGAEVSVAGVDVVLETTTDQEKYSVAIGRIRDYIAAGDCYQVNHTFRLQGTFDGNLSELYAQIGAAQQAQFCAYLDTGRFTVLSASPELFFALKDGVITARPMKGTACRGFWTEEDQAAIEKLRNSLKEQSENLMIVDLLRNDLGIIAETGSVSVDALFEVETYPTIHQMTSTVTARLRPDVGLVGIFKALFPCGSVTGTPKRRSMEIIAELENDPRGVYCGALGYVAPGGEALFSVVIRTMLFDKHTNHITMGLGSAVTWDSKAELEYAECLGKGAFVTRQKQNFRLIESLRLENGVYTLLDRHMSRLADSARQFGFIYDYDKIRRTLLNHAIQAAALCKVRLLLAEDGEVDINSEALLDSSSPLCVAISAVTVDSHDRMRYHKTTQRDLLDAARAFRQDCDEVLFLNEHGQLTEGSYHTLVVKLDDRLVTPPLSCGLLPGVQRAEQLHLGDISERILYPDDLKRAEELWLINSVRGWRRCFMI